MRGLDLGRLRRYVSIQAFPRSRFGCARGGMRVLGAHGLDAPSLFPAALAAQKQRRAPRVQLVSRASQDWVSRIGVNSSWPWRRNARIGSMLANAASLRGSEPALYSPTCTRNSISL